MRLLSLFLLVTTAMFAKTLQCKTVGIVYVESQKVKLYTDEEINQAPKFVINNYSDRLIVNLPSGNKDVYELKHTTNDTVQFYSLKSNVWIYKDLKKLGIYMMYTKINGVMYAHIMDCK